MINRLYHATLLVMYQLTLLVGIAMLPVALVTKRFGFRLPLDRVVMGLKQNYERAQQA